MVKRAAAAAKGEPLDAADDLPGEAAVVGPRASRHGAQEHRG